MKTYLRWGKFNLVGAMGMVVQLGVLAVLNRCTGGRYLVASAVALEVTLVHNFLWHRRFTWRERREGGAGSVRRFLRFQLSNGMVSLVGNLVLMRLLVRGAHVPVVAANVGAILCCSTVNFFVGDRWIFGGATAHHLRRREIDGVETGA